MNYLHTKKFVMSFNSDLPETKNLQALKFDEHLFEDTTKFSILFYSAAMTCTLLSGILIFFMTQIRR